MANEECCGNRNADLQSGMGSYPRSIFLIVATEFCERFSFSGLRSKISAILSLYLRNVLLFHENQATVIYHVFIMSCFFVPVVGAILADSFLGRFRTILYFSTAYAMGNVLLCFAATPPLAVWPTGMTSISLALIAWGTGGIKPCVAAFACDQFHLPEEEQRLQTFFLIFYFTINFGAFTGMLVTPILKQTVSCFGDDTCYALGFGLPAVLMLVALIMFSIGKPLYRIKYPKQNVMLNFIRCISYAIRRRLTDQGANGRKYNHWVDYAEDKYSAKLIADIKTVLAIFFLYIPLPLFWSLFDQQGSRWTFQASRMNGQIFGMQLLPDQMQVINPAMVLLLIPLFDKLIYPCLTATRLLRSPLQRMITGGVFAGLAFLTSAILELKLQVTYPLSPSKGEASLNIINTLGCDIGLSTPFDSGPTLKAGARTVFNVTAHNFTQYELRFYVQPLCRSLELENPTLRATVTTAEYQVETLIVGLDPKRRVALFRIGPDEYEKSLSGRPRLRVVFLRDSKVPSNVTITLAMKSGHRDACLVLKNKFLAVSTYLELEPGIIRYSVRSSGDLYVNHRESITLELGGVYILVLREHAGKIAFHKVLTTTPPNEVHMFWLVPQYLLISMAEIMFAISGLEFSFVQAPKSMKTVTIAAWYVSVALGNMMVIVITQARLFKSQAHEFFLFAGLIMADMAVFSLIVRRHTFVVLETDSSDTPPAVGPDNRQETHPLLKQSFRRNCRQDLCELDSATSN